jgi:AbrB family looped-hinge helix DNA binding protein
MITRTGTFVAEIEADGKLVVPSEIRERLNMVEGDKVEIMLKKIRSRRIEVNISKNPLYRLLQIPEQKG